MFRTLGTFTTLDDIMIINDGFIDNHYRKIEFNRNGGLGYKPNKNNVFGGTIINNKHVGLNTDELDKLNEDELRKTLDSNYNLFNIIQPDEILNDEQKWDLKQIEDETEYIENLLEEKERHENEEEEEEEDEELEEIKNEYKYYMENIETISVEELLNLDIIISRLNSEGILDDEEVENIENHIREIKIKKLGIKPVKRTIFSKDYNDEIHYKYYKHPEDITIKQEIIEGSINPIINEGLDNIEKNIDIFKEIYGENYIENNFDIFLGNSTEEEFISHINFIKKIYDYKGIIYNTSDEKCKYYSDKLINRYKYFYNLNIKNNGKDKNDKTKLDYMVYDFISENCCLELKTLSKTYDEYKEKGFINLVSNKITGENGEFKPIYNPLTKKVKNILCESSNTIFECLKNNKEMELIIIFCLKDGNYIYKPLEDENFKYEKDSKGNYRGYLTYSKIYNKDYKIPIKKLKKIV